MALASIFARRRGGIEIYDARKQFVNLCDGWAMQKLIESIIICSQRMSKDDTSDAPDGNGC